MIRKQLRILEHYVDYFIPREVTGPVLIAIIAEQVVSEVFQLHIPPSLHMEGWFALLLLVTALVTVWGEVDEDKEELEENLEEVVS